MRLLQPPQSAARCHPRWWRETRHGAPGRWRGSLWHVEVEITSLAPLLFMPLYLVSSLLFFFGYLSSCCLFLKQPHASLSSQWVFFIHLILSTSSRESSYLVCMGNSIIHLFISFTVMPSCSKFQRKLRGQSRRILWVLSILMFFLIAASEVPHYIIESWKLPLVLYSLSFLFMTYEWSNHLSHSYVLHLRVDDRKDYPIHLLLCEALHHCHSSGLVCRTRGISFSVTVWDLVFSHHMLPSRAWYWNTMTGLGPCDDLYRAITPLACGLVCLQI